MYAYSGGSGPLNLGGSLNVSVFEFASSKGFDESARINAQTCLSFR